MRLQSLQRTRTSRSSLRRPQKRSSFAKARPCDSKPFKLTRHQCPKRTFFLNSFLQRLKTTDSNLDGCKGTENMNRILILIGALALAVQAANAQGRDFSGKQLYSDCKALLVVVHGSPTLGEITDAGYCAGFLHGFNSGFASATLKGTDIYCDPAGLSLDTQAQI